MTFFVDHTEVAGGDGFHQGGCHVESFGQRRIVVFGGATVAEMGTQSKGWPAAQARPCVPDGYFVCAQNRHSMGRLSAGDGLFRHDVMEPAGRVGPGGRMDETPSRTARTTASGQPDRLVEGGRRQRQRARGRGGEKTGPNPTDRRKRGSKHHILTDAAGTPLAATLTAANRHDVTQLIPLVDAVSPVKGKRGRPRQRPKLLYADRAYHSYAHRMALWARGIGPAIAHRGAPHGSGLGKYRWVVERTLSWLHQFRRLRVRYDRRADIHQSFLNLACSIICCRKLKQAYF